MSSRAARSAERPSGLPFSKVIRELRGSSAPDTASSILEQSMTRQVREVLRRDLEAIDASLGRVRSEHNLRIEETARRLLLGKGKRARSLLTCSFCRAVGGDPAPHIDVVTAVELAHSGSLLHDDILDGAETRRGRRCAHLVFDVSTAILAGDLLLALALERVSASPSRSLRSRFSKAIRDLCIGEALERERRFDATADLTHARRVNRLKTASLFAYAAEAGAILGGAEDEVRSAAWTHGVAVGEAFQLTDDLLDVQGRAGAMGKSIGMDLKAGLITVPVAIALERDPALREHVGKIWDSGDGAGRTVRQLSERMEYLGAFAATRALAGECVERARVAVEALPGRLWRDQLATFAGVLAGRRQ